MNGFLGDNQERASETLLFLDEQVDKSHKKVKNMKKKFAMLLLAILAVSSLSFIAGAYAMPFMSWSTVPNPTPNAIGFRQSSYVCMFGRITEWLTKPTTTPVLGMIEAQSRTTVGSAHTIEGFSATAIWTNNTVRPLADVRARENFTYAFYAARLVKGNYSALDPTSAISWFMNGTWNVWSITTNFIIVTDSSGNILSVTTTRSLVALATNAIGNLTVASGWSTFTLAIEGVPSLTGPVIAHIIASRTFSPFMLGTGSTSTTVTPADLNSIVNAYGSMPGWGNYDLRMDYCLHYQIDICDLSTAAANLNTT